jgi:hypothetical protein
MVNDGIDRVKQAYIFLRLATYCAAAKLLKPLYYYGALFEIKRRGSRRAKRFIIGIVAILSVGGCWAAALIAHAGLLLLFIPELHARLLGAGTLALASAMVYYLVKLWRALARW